MLLLWYAVCRLLEVFVKPLSGIALVHWNRSHDPWTEHAKRSPICGLITGAYNGNWPSCTGCYVSHFPFQRTSWNKNGLAHSLAGLCHPTLPQSLKRYSQPKMKKTNVLLPLAQLALAGFFHCPSPQFNDRWVKGNIVSYVCIRLLE